MNQRKLAVIELTPTDDAFIASFKPDVPIGDIGLINLNGTGVWWECSLYTQKHVCLYYGCEWHEDEGICNGRMHPSDTEGYLKFDLSDIPSGWRIVKATLSIFGIQRLGERGVIRFYRCYADDWSEDEITWNNFNPLCDEIPDDGKYWEYGYVDFDLTRSITACFNEGKRYAAFKMTDPKCTSWASKEWPDREPYLTITLEEEVLPEICTWIDSKGGPTGLTIAGIFEIIDSFVFQTPPTGYTFIPTLDNVFGVIDYFLGFNGDPLTGCDYFGG